MVVHHDFFTVRMHCLCLALVRVRTTQMRVVPGCRVRKQHRVQSLHQIFMLRKASEACFERDYDREMWYCEVSNGRNVRASEQRFDGIVDRCDALRR